MNEFKIGDIVEWKSQSQGYKRTKQGRIVKIVSPNTAPGFFDYELTHHCMFEGLSRKKESYLVEVKGGPKAEPRLYWPRTKWLKKIK